MTVTADSACTRVRMRAGLVVGGMKLDVDSDPMKTEYPSALFTADDSR